MGKFETFTRPCRQCNQPLVTTSRREVVHAWCRQEYYKGKRKTRSRISFKNAVRVRFRSRFHTDQECAVCGVHPEGITLTKSRNVYFENAPDKEPIKMYLCPTCLALRNCGYIEYRMDPDTGKGLWVRIAPEAAGA